MIGRDGSFTLRGLTAGVLPLQVQATGRLVAVSPVVLTGDADERIRLAEGPAPATFKAWIISAGAGVPEISGTATSSTGAVLSFGPLTDGGHVLIAGLQPGTYTFDATSFTSTVITDDGPWWFGPPGGSFTLRGGGTTDLNTIELHAHE